MASHRRTFRSRVRNEKFFWLIPLLVIILSLAAAPVCQAVTYYVSPSGNNLNIGSVAKPFKTIGYGIAKLNKGDTLFVRNGTYNEQVSIYGKDGSIEDPITILAFPNEKPVIDGNGINLGVGSGLVAIWQNYIHFKGFEVRNSNRSGIVCAGNAGHCVISGCTVHGIWETGIGYYGDYGTVEFCTVFDACLSNSDGIYTPPETWGAGINVRRHPVARNNIVHDVWGEGLSVTVANNGIIELNEIYDICSVHLYIMNCQDCLIQKNLIYMTKTINSVNSVGIGQWNEETNNRNARNRIINNIVYKCRRNLFNDSPLDGTVIANNTFVNSTNEWGVQLSGGNSLSGYFMNNIVVQDDNLPCIYATSGQNITYANNLYNKSYDIDATGSADIIDDPMLLMESENGSGKPDLSYFKLKQGSHAIDKGTSSAGVTEDIFGNFRDNHPDIGAHEFNSSGPYIRVAEIIVTAAGGKTEVVTGSTLQLFAEIKPFNATNNKLTWKVTDGTDHASISPDGLLDATSAGQVTITASSTDGSGVIGNILINVYEPPSERPHIIVKPNPASSFFFILIKNQDQLHPAIRISDLTGRIVFFENSDTDLIEFRIPGLVTNGIYFVQLISDHIIYDTEKVVVIN